MRVNLRKRHMGGQFSAIEGSFRVIIVIWFLIERQKNAVRGRPHMTSDFWVGR